MAAKKKRSSRAKASARGKRTPIRTDTHMLIQQWAVDSPFPEMREIAERVDKLIRENIRPNIIAAYIGLKKQDRGRQKGAIGENQKVIRDLLRKNLSAQTENLWHAFKKLRPGKLKRSSFSGEVTKARNALGVKKLANRPKR